ncbi:B- and T-lymphocyte attenuator-like isoform X5 [Myxocyprinus asiaticus]|uniref:B- and T-lymphocyte attenuator-like isoform X4 n=1 Tax=Myxocyprinus asiaticus TaxID=70543 RepID=UPI00222330EF|nr:B- and T-lymphocyte attenuator-like isoform X4 [Myxocyprinus asiaticus]XP_051558963.1 B- and T-lymphocyte attenuator-like isoform X5 [Myxocyprinus asiaticus]
MVRDVIEIICYLVAYLTLLLLSVSGNTNGSEINCIATIKVPRNTQFRAHVMTLLIINCTVIVHECQNSSIYWCKIYGNDCKALNHSNNIKAEWKSITEHDGIAFLTFLNISTEDEGLYRCRLGETTVSHSINVTVTVGNEEVFLNQSKTGDLNTFPKDGLQWLWPYVYICSGIVGLVVIVMTLSLFIIRRQGTKSTRKNKTTKNQNIGTQRSDQSPPHHNTHSTSAHLSSALSCVYETPPVRTGSSSGRFSANMAESKGSHNNISTGGGEENALVYASLNHQAISRGPKRTARQEPEPSEYAAIRFR